MQAAKIPAAKKAAPKKRGPKRPAAEHDFDAYRNWAREASADQTILSDQDITEDWASLTNEYKADFVKATREFKDAEQARAVPNISLIDALKAVLALSDPDGENRVSTRVLLVSAKRHHEGLTEALKLREAATADISSHLDALDQVLQTRPRGRVEKYLQDHQHAVTILQWIHYGGLHQDWELRDDLFVTKKQADQTKSIHLEALNRDGHWQFNDVVGEGGNGRAALYVKFDEHGKILQRIVSKESFIGRYWNDPNSWYGEVNDRVPIEAGIHRLLPGHRHIIEYLGFHLNKRLRMVRLYTAFAQLGDLLDLIHTHKELESLHDEHGRSPQAKSPVPNLAVLYIFEAMAAGVCLMAHGVLPQPDIKGNWPNNDGMVSWDHDIIHRDIKANNFFLSASSSNLVWPGLPVAALGDFGNAIDAADEVYAWHPRWARGCGTPGYMAPEQVEKTIEFAYEHPITSATNVYQIGVSMLQLMIRSGPQFQPEFGKSDANFFKRNSDDCYDGEIVNLAWDCAAMDPANRPSARDLYIRLRTLARAYPNADGDHSVPYQFMRLNPTELVRTAPDKYAHLLA